MVLSSVGLNPTRLVSLQEDSPVKTGCASGRQRTCKPGNAKDYWQPLEAGRGQEGSSPRAFGGSLALPVPRQGTSGTQTASQRTSVVLVTALWYLITARGSHQAQITAGVSTCRRTVECKYMESSRRLLRVSSSYQWGECRE